MFWDGISYWNTDFLVQPEFYLGTLIFSIIAYLIGSINGGQILSYIGSRNLGETGTKNYGATNAGRVYGAKGFIAVFLFDMIKAIVAVTILTLILNSTEGRPDSVFYYASIPISMGFLIIGHMWPIYFRFKGGKGIASSFGLIITFNWVIAIISIVIFLVLIKLLRRVGISSVIGSLIGIALIIFVTPFLSSSNLFFYWTSSWLVIVVSALLGILIVFKHRDNIMVVASGKEPLRREKKVK